MTRKASSMRRKDNMEVACKNEFEEELKKMSTDSDSFTVSSIIDSNKQEKITG